MLRKEVRTEKVRKVVYWGPQESWKEPKGKDKREKHFNVYCLGLI